MFFFSFLKHRRKTHVVCLLQYAIFIWKVWSIAGKIQHEIHRSFSDLSPNWLSVRKVKYTPSSVSFSCSFLTEWRLTKVSVSFPQSANSRNTFSRLPSSQSFRTSELTLNSPFALGSIARRMRRSIAPWLSGWGPAGGGICCGAGLGRATGKGGKVFETLFSSKCSSKRLGTTGLETFWVSGKRPSFSGVDKMPDFPRCNGDGDGTAIGSSSSPGSRSCCCSPRPGSPHRPTLYKKIDQQICCSLNFTQWVISQKKTL